MKNAVKNKILNYNFPQIFPALIIKSECRNYLAISINASHLSEVRYRALELNLVLNRN